MPAFFTRRPARRRIGLTVFRSDLTYESFQSDPEGLPLSQALNRTETGGRAEVYYRAFYKGYIFLGLGRTEYRFQSPDMAWRDSSARQASLGVNFPLGGSIEGTLSLGYKELRPRQGGGAVFTGFVGSADLAARLGRFAFRGRFGRDNVFSTFADVLYFIDTKGGLGMSFYLADFLRLDYDFDLGTSDYPDEPASAAGPGAGDSAGRRDRRTTHTAGNRLPHPAHGRPRPDLERGRVDIHPGGLGPPPQLRRSLSDLPVLIWGKHEQRRRP